MHIDWAARPPRLSWATWRHVTVTVQAHEAPVALVRLPQLCLLLPPISCSARRRAFGAAAISKSQKDAELVPAWPTRQLPHNTGSGGELRVCCVVADYCTLQRSNTCNCNIGSSSDANAFAERIAMMLYASVGSIGSNWHVPLWLSSMFS